MQIFLNKYLLIETFAMAYSLLSPMTLALPICHPLMLQPFPTSSVNNKVPPSQLMKSIGAAHDPLCTRSPTWWHRETLRIVIYKMFYVTGRDWTENGMIFPFTLKMLLLFNNTFDLVLVTWPILMNSSFPKRPDRPPQAKRVIQNQSG